MRLTVYNLQPNKPHSSHKPCPTRNRTPQIPNPTQKTSTLTQKLQVWIPKPNRIEPKPDPQIFTSISDSCRWSRWALSIEPLLYFNKGCFSLPSWSCSWLLLSCLMWFLLTANSSQHIIGQMRLDCYDINSIRAINQEFFIIRVARNHLFS